MRFFFSFFFFLFMLSSFISGLSASPASIDVEYLPGEESILGFNFYSEEYDILQFSVSGDQGLLNDFNFLNLDDGNLKDCGGAVCNIQFSLLIPEFSTPGYHNINVFGTPYFEDDGFGGEMVALPKIGARVRTYVPYPNKYLEILYAELYENVERLSQNDSVYLDIKIRNRGSEVLTDFSSSGVIKSGEGEELYTLDLTGSFSDRFDQLGVEESINVYHLLNFSEFNLGLGEYIIFLEIDYGGDDVVKSGTNYFYIGEEIVDVTSISKNVFSVDSINHFSVILTNKWITELSGYLKLELINLITGEIVVESVSKTLTVGFSDQTIDFYLDLDGIKPGNYSLKFTSYFDDVPDESIFDVVLFDQVTGQVVDSNSNLSLESSAGGSLIYFVIILVMFLFIISYIIMKKKRSKFSNNDIDEDW